MKATMTNCWGPSLTSFQHVCEVWPLLRPHRRR